MSALKLLEKVEIKLTLCDGYHATLTIRDKKEILKLIKAANAWPLVKELLRDYAEFRRNTPR